MGWGTTHLEHGNQVYTQYPTQRAASSHLPRPTYWREEEVTSTSHPGIACSNGKFLCVSILASSFAITIVFFTLGGMGYTGLLVCSPVGNGLLIGGGLGSFILFAITCCCCSAKAQQNKHYHYDRE